MGVLAELVHGVTDNCKVDQGILEEAVVLVVPVGQNKKLEELRKLELCLLI